jgi:hypothetical protein
VGSRFSLKPQGRAESPMQTKMSLHVVYEGDEDPFLWHTDDSIQHGRDLCRAEACLPLGDVASKPQKWSSARARRRSSHLIDGSVKNVLGSIAAAP